MRKLSIAIIGCGKIAEAHANILKTITNVRLVATCDKEILMSKQLAERYGAEAFYDDLIVMLKKSNPDIVHVTTPPQTHFEIAKKCLEAGCHVFVEKPFTVNYHEAEELISLAIRKDRYLTIGTDEQFSYIAIKARELIKSGWLGGNPVHMEVYHGYDFGDDRYARVFLRDRDHWVWKLPGQLIQNIIPHPVMRIAEYIRGDEFQIFTKGFTSKYIKSLGENILIDEFRTLIIDKNNTTAYITFSTEMRPQLHQFRIYGPKNGLLIDQDQHVLIKLSGERYKSYFEKFIGPLKMSGQFRHNAYSNMKLFLKRKFQMKRGLYNLIVLFYKAIIENSDLPIPYEKILLSAKIIDSIINSLYNNKGF